MLVAKYRKQKEIFVVALLASAFGAFMFLISWLIVGMFLAFLYILRFYCLVVLERYVMNSKEFIDKVIEVVEHCINDLK